MRPILAPTLALSLVLAAALPAWASGPFTFDSIDGGTIALDEMKGGPVLVVNTASRCSFTPQYDGLQALYDRYRDRGLTVLAVPSQDFRQELESDEAVRDYCAINFDLDLPMTTITTVTGPDAHPFYAWLEADHDVRPAWNFNKVLLDSAGDFVAFWGSTTQPLSQTVTARIEPLLGPASDQALSRP